MQDTHKEHEMTKVLTRSLIHADTSGVLFRSAPLLRKSLLLFLGFG